MVTLGLTGSIGMGKSTTAGLFREAGVPVFDADEAVHQLYRGEAVAPVEAAFPGVTSDGQIDRLALRGRVLGDHLAMSRLEAIVHPLVAKRRQAFLDHAQAEGRRLVVLDIPLLFEIGADRDVDRVVVVSAPEAVQKARVLARPGMTQQAFSAILVKQVPDAEKRRRAQYIVDTGSGIEAARTQVNAIVTEILASP